MDNVTHALSGLVLGDALLSMANKTRRGTGNLPRRSVLTVAAIASNIPDIDLLYTGIVEGKLGYLLHHRGHTHTFAVAIGLGLLVAGIAVLWLRGASHFRHRAQPSPLWPLWLAGATGGLLHLVMDLGNSYGVHPAWPVDNRWWYGDTFFIIEPWWLILLVGTCMRQSSNRWARCALLAIPAAAMALCWQQPAFVAPATAAVVTVGGSGWLLWQLLSPSTGRLRTFGWAAMALVAAFSWGRQRAATEIAGQLHPVLSPTLNAQLMEVSATPAPGNPLCWALVALTLQGSNYGAVVANVSAWPWLQSAEACPQGPTEQTAPLSTVPDNGSSATAIRWKGQFSAPLQQLRDLLSSHCKARAYLRFSRAPFWLPDADNALATVFGDLRFDRSRSLDFAELSVHPEQPCPEAEPPWLPPRQDLIEFSRGSRSSTPQRSVLLSPEPGAP